MRRSDEEMEASLQTGKKVDIDKVIADIENAIAENGDGAKA